MRWLVGILSVLLAVSISAQEDAQSYTLTTPDAAEYLAAIPQILDQGGADVRRVVTAELERYSDLGDESFTMLYNAYEILQPVDWVDFETADQWPEWLVLAWLRDNDVALTTGQFAFEDYRLDVTTVDLNGNAQQDYLLEVRSDLYHSFWVLAADENASSGYRRIEMPARWFSITCPLQLSCGGDGSIFSVQDINRDGLPEVSISGGQCAYGRCAASLDIFAWRDGAMVNIGDGAMHWEIVSGGGGVPAAPPDGTWTFQSVDDDPPLEMVQTGTINGSMACTFQITRVFDWDASIDRYMAGDETITYDESEGCARRQAHFALLDNDYEAAITHYERAITLLPTDSGELGQYVRLRLALAYALDGHTDTASAMLADLADDPPTTQVMDTMIAAAYDAYTEDNNPVALCAALYTSVQDYDVWGEQESQLFSFAAINDYAVPLTYVGGTDFGPTVAGCNLFGLFRQFGEGISMSQGDPLRQLTNSGWAITDTFNADLNLDGTDDWIIWTEQIADYALALMSSDGDSYTGSFIVLQPDLEHRFATVPGPADGEYFVIHLSAFIETRCPNENSARRMIVYRLIDEKLEREDYFTLCDFASTDAIFLNTQSLVAWRNSNVLNCPTQSFIPVTFTWSANEERFVHPETIPCPDEVTMTTPPEVDLFSCGRIGEDFCGFYWEGQDALDAIDTVLAPPSADADANFLLALRYHRASTLQELVRPDEALAEYVALFEDAPDSAWGMLARLHIAPAG